MRVAGGLGTGRLPGRGGVLSGAGVCGPRTRYSTYPLLDGSVRQINCAVPGALQLQRRIHRFHADTCPARGHRRAGARCLPSRQGLPADLAPPWREVVIHPGRIHLGRDAFGRPLALLRRWNEAAGRRDSGPGPEGKSQRCDRSCSRTRNSVRGTGQRSGAGPHTPPLARRQVVFRPSAAVSGRERVHLRSTWMRWYPNAELEVFDDAGHFAPEESPEALATVVERFLGR